MKDSSRDEAADVIIIGAGQAGLSAAWHLRRRGLEPGRDFVVLDANPGPGGAWRHRWDSLTLGAAHRLHDLPGLPLGPTDPDEPASAVVARYYGRYEEQFNLSVRRPVRVQSVRRTPEGLVIEDGTGQELAARIVINATGTWDRPYWPWYPGRDRFAGRQLHTRDFRAAADFAGQRVLVVGAGTSAVQFLLQLHAAGARTLWSTQRPPEFTRSPFDAEWGRAVEAKVRERTRAGLAPQSVVSVTGLPLTEEYRQGIDAGILVSRGPLRRLLPDAAEFADGSVEPVDAVLWATGFRASLDHLAPLRLREPGGGIRVDGVRAAREPRLLLVGYGESASTLGATRAGRAAALEAVAQLSATAEGLPTRTG